MCIQMLYIQVWINVLSKGFSAWSLYWNLKVFIDFKPLWFVNKSFKKTVFIYLLTFLSSVASVLFLPGTIYIPHSALCSYASQLSFDNQFYEVWKFITLFITSKYLYLTSVVTEGKFNDWSINHLISFEMSRKFHFSS